MKRKLFPRLFPNLGFGLGLRSDHYSAVLSGRSHGHSRWFEVISENFMGAGGRPITILEKVRQDYPIALHGVSLSLGSSDNASLSDKEFRHSYLKKLKSLVDRIEPAVVSDHCCWTRVNGENLHDLLPLPYTEEAVVLMVDRIQKVQDALGRRILLENVSSYMTFNHSVMTEWEFLSEISNRSDCGLLLDINNIYVSSVNHHFSPSHFIQGLPVERIGQIHLAGHSVQYDKAGNKFLIDTHDHPVCDEVWELFRESVSRFGQVSTMIEWDSHIPSYEDLEKELLKAVRIEEQLLDEPDSRRTAALA